MAFESFRPWGRLPWLLDRAGGGKWAYLGCLSPEDRTLTTWSFLNKNNYLGAYRFVQVIDRPSRFSERARRRTGRHREQFESEGGDTGRISEVDLFCRVGTIVDIADAFVSHGGENLIIDITTFPKRFFFPIVRRVLDESGADNIIASYTLAGEYATGDLAEDPEPWRKLPLFPERFPPEEPEILVVALGFQPLGLPEMMENSYADAKTTLLFPFPAPPSNVRRVWEVVDRLEDYLPAPGIEPKFVAGHNLPEVFAHIREATSSGDQYSVLAPYGPKPMSLAMALIGRLGDFPCYYTQPRVYNPEYSKGVKMSGGQPECVGYYLRLGGEAVYSF